MDLQEWKRFKRSGAYRRTVNKRHAESVTQKRLYKVNSEKAEIRNLLEGSVHSESDIFAREITNNSEDSEYESDGETFDYEKNIQLRKEVKMWAIKHNISHLAYNELSVIFNKRINNVLPMDARTLLHTTREKIHIVELGTGYYWHNGLKRQLIKCFENDAIPLPDKFSLNINIDGLPIYNSSRQQFWPILCNIFESPVLPPLVIGIYAGDSKPSDLEAFLDPLIGELNELFARGLSTRFNNTPCPVKVRAFICDTPARALIKGVVNFNGKHGCLKCTVIGEYSHVSHTVTFLGSDCPLRNDNDFRAKKDEEHHKADSPLLKLNIDMVEDIPVCDSLHLIDLGVMKRLLIGWRDGNLGKYITKWCSKDIERVNEFLSKCRMPQEIHRAVRTIVVLAHWKGSEYRTFFYYLSLVILKDTLPPQAYYHFLHLFCSITICSNEKHFKLLSIAEQMLQRFVVIFKNIYGKDYVSSNIHNLTHVVQEVRRFGKLQSFNAYPFENKLYVIKNMIRQGNKPLQQVARRLNERFHIEYENMNLNNTKYPFIKKNQCKGTKQLYFSSFILSAQDRNKWFMNEEGNVIELQSIYTNNENNSKEILIQGYRIENLHDVFEEPLRSSYLSIYKTDRDNLKKKNVVCKASNVKCKLVKIEYKSELFFVPLLHTL